MKLCAGKGPIGSGRSAEPRDLGKAGPTRVTLPRSPCHGAAARLVYRGGRFHTASAFCQEPALKRAVSTRQS